MTVFDHYAAYYDLLYKSKDYGSEALYVSRHLREVDPQAQRILELGCGTGAHGAELSRLGYRVLGVDFSERMLSLAKRRRDTLPHDQQSRLRFVGGDARYIRLDHTFDAVISLFHVMSYQTGNDELLATFSTAAAHLTPEGFFLFDFWYGPAVIAQRPETRVRDLQDETVRVTRIARPQLRDDANVVDVHFEVLVEEKATGRVARFEETHAMRYLFLPEIDSFLERSGFRRQAAKEWMTDRKPSLSSWSGFIVARKFGGGR